MEAALALIINPFGNLILETNSQEFVHPSGVLTVGCNNFSKSSRRKKILFEEYVFLQI